ncbi:unnamed protein product [Larinioides sclopetarius]|uniref:Ribosomal protein S19 n=1 Tax=Larinioides sclopetarius TaxID=280406 RepID=A0AAV1ZZD9_9ARAC
MEKIPKKKWMLINKPSWKPLNFSNLSDMVITKLRNRDFREFYGSGKVREIHKHQRKLPIKAFCGKYLHGN